MRYYNNGKTTKESSSVFAVFVGFVQFFRAPISSLFFTLIVSFALFLATMFYILWSNTAVLDSKWNESAEISLYLKQNVSLTEANSLIEKLQANPVVEKATLIEQDEGMKGFIESTMLDTLLSSFKKNPLPNVIVVHPKVKLMSEKVTADFTKELEDYLEVETVKSDSDWIKWSYSLLNLIGELSLALVLALCINVLLVICGISYIMTQFFISRYETKKEVLQFQFGWYGLISSLFALLLVSSVLALLQQHGILLSGLRIGGWLFIVFITMFLSFFSSRFAIQLYD